MKNSLKPIALLFALVFAAVFAFAETPAEQAEAAPTEYKQKLEEIKIKFYDLFHPVDRACVSNDETLLWHGTRGFERYDLNFLLIHSHMAGITNLANAMKYLSLVEQASPIKGAYILTFWAPELLFQLPYEEVMDYYAAMQEKEIPIPKIISEKIEEEHKTDPAFWNYKLSKIDRDIYVKTNKVSIASELLRDFDKTIPKENRNAKEKCVEARFINLLEGSENAAKYLLKEIANEKDPNERQTLFLKAVTYSERDSSYETLEALSADQDIPDLYKILLHCRRNFFDVRFVPLWERVVFAKDPGSALEAWDLFISRYYYVFQKGGINDYLFSKEENEKFSKWRELKDRFLDYLKSEAPFKEEDFYKLLSEEELKEELKETGRERRCYALSDIVSGRKKKLLLLMQIFNREEELLAYGKRRAEKLAELEERSFTEAGGEEKFPEELDEFLIIYRDEAKLYGFMPIYKEAILSFVEKHPELFQPVKYYCEVLYKEGRKKEAEEFLSKNYPEEKLIRHPEELENYADLCKYNESPFDEKAAAEKIFEFWLPKDAEALAAGNQYLWERLWTGEYRDVRKAVREKIAALPKRGPALLKRLKEICTKEDYEAILTKTEAEPAPASNSPVTQTETKGGDKQEISESEGSDDADIQGEFGVYYPNEVKKRYEACKKTNDPEKERWALELALLEGRFDYKNIVQNLPLAWNEKRPLLAFQQSVWYIENTGMLLPGLSFLLDHFAKEKRIPEERWLRVFNNVSSYMGSETNVFVRRESRFSRDFLKKLNSVRPIFSDHRIENAISSYYLKILTDKFTGKIDIYSDVYSLLEDNYFDVYEERKINESSLQYLFAIFVDSRTNDLNAALGGVIDVIRLCQKSYFFEFDKLAALSLKKVENITLNAETDEGKTTVARYLSICERLFSIAEDRKNPALKTFFKSFLPGALEQAFRAFAKADRYDEYWYYLREDLKYFKGSEALRPFISICGDIKKNRAFVLDMFIYFLLDFSSEDMAVLRGVPNYETLSKLFTLGSAEEELRKVDVSENKYTNVMHKILNAAVARNDSNEVKRINWQLETYHKICQERLETKEKEREERRKKLKEEIDDFCPYSSIEGRIYYRKERLRDKELEREKEGKSPLEGENDVFDRWLGSVVRGRDDWNGRAEYMKKKWEKEAEKHKAEEAETEADGETEATDKIEE